MEGNIAATYTLIYRFLKQQSQHKAAEAVKKAAKAVVVLRGDIGQEGPPLEDIIKEWKLKEEDAKLENVDPSSGDSDSSDVSSSDSEDDSSSDADSRDTSSSENEGDDTNDSADSGDGSDVATTAKKSARKAPERDTSATLSSGGDRSQEIAKQEIQIPKKRPTRDTDKPTQNEDESSRSDSSDPEGPDNSSKSPAPDSSDAKSSSSDSGSSGSSDSGDEDEADANENASANGKKTTKGKSPSTSESSSESEDDSDSESEPEEGTRVAKKRKMSENGAAVTTTLATGLPQQKGEASRGKGNPPPRAKERFQRVKVQNLASDLLLNNGYEARGGVANDYGERAHRDLIVTRGAGFRKEKNKKKRGSYRGGEITMENHSIKFDD